MKTTNKLLSILLVVIMLLSTVIIPFNTIKSEAAAISLAAFNQKLTTFKSIYPNNSTFTDNAEAYGGYECFGFANCIAKYMFGSYPTSSGSAISNVNSEWKITYGGSAVNNLAVGDIVRYAYGSYDHSIFITSISGSTIYYCQANVPANTNKITYSNSIASSTLKEYVSKKLNGNSAKTGWVAHYKTSVLGGDSQNTLTIRYNANGGSISSDITTVEYKVTESAGINMRSGAGTSYSVIKSLPLNTVFSVAYSERKTANGYTWGKTTYGGKTGWVVISDFVKTTAINRTTDFYLYSSLVYRTSTISVLQQNLSYGQELQSGLYNVQTFGLEREGYKFVGWCTTADASTAVYDHDDATIKPETIYPNLKNESATVILYAIWECIHKYDNNCDTSCNTCGATRTITHDYKAATCTAAKTCKICGTTSGNKLSHKSDSGTVTKVATCTATGTMTYKCTLCKDEIKTEIIAKVAHKYDAGKVTKEATCKETGVKTYTCSSCKGTKTETIAKLTTHTYSNNCDKSCNVCGETRTTSDHVFDNDCDVDCNECGDTRVPADHVYNSCYDNEYHWLECDCGDIIDLTGHIFSKYVQDGAYHYKECSCGAKTEPVKHNFINYDYNDNTHWTFCDCGKIDEENVYGHGYGRFTTATEHWLECECGHEIDRGNHSWENATCKAPKTCKVCGATSGSKLSHKSDNGTVTKKATCKDTGTKTYKCTLCKEVIKTETIQKNTTHTYDNACDKSCNVCGKTRSVSDHVYDNACDADCNNCGIKRVALNHKYSNNCDKTCNICGKTRTVSDHDYEKVVTKATTSKNGKIVEKCAACGKEKSTTTIYYAKTFSLSKTSYTYNGKVQKPSVTVKDSKGKTISSSNYTVTYSSGLKNAGTYTVTVTMKGNYTGTKTLSYKINPIDVSKCKISLSKTSYTYNGKVQKPTVTVKSATGTKLTSSSYTVKYSSGLKNAGTYTVTVTMKGNYSGTKKLTYKINPAKISSYKLSATSYTYNGKTKTPSVTVKNASGTKLTKNTHFTVTYSSGRKNVGTYKVTIKGKGNYTGTKTLTFKINPKAASVNSLTAGTKKLTVKLNRSLKQSTGYEVQYSTSKTFKNAKTKTITKYTTSSTTLTGLNAKTTYYVRVRTYKTVNGKKYYSNWSSYKHKKTK